MNNKDVSEMEPRYGAIAVVKREHEFLVIQRAQDIRAGGKFCFPGGTQEEGETSREAVIREMQEELAVDVEPGEVLWESVTYWNVNLTFWECVIRDGQIPKPNPDEVQWFGWMTIEEMVNEPRMLISNDGILKALAQGKIKFAE